MTPDEINSVIAAACGWDKVGLSLAGLGGYPPIGFNTAICTQEFNDDKIRYGKPEGKRWYRLPNYYGNLNACAEFAKTLNANEQVYYWDALYQVANNGNVYWSDDSSEHNCYATANATAPQRCEAFLRVKGLWKD